MDNNLTLNRAKLILISLLVCCAALGCAAQESAPTLTPQWSEKIKPQQKEVVEQIINDMVYIPATRFVMGTDVLDTDGRADERPKHWVELDPYYIGRHEVTQAEWKALMGRNPSKHKGDSLPVGNISYDDCKRFVNKLQSLSGLEFRLPSEAEWENAAHANGSPRNYKYSGSNNDAKVAWTEFNSGLQSHKICSKMPNEIGLYDMSGNVWEWCYDWYDGTYYPESPDKNPLGPETPGQPSPNMVRVVRGGSYMVPPVKCRVGYRGVSIPTGASEDIGMRLAIGSGVPPMGRW